jgi:hypothetical protein
MLPVVSLSKILTMPSVISSEIQDVMQAVHYRPAISIIMPFEPKMNLKASLDHSLKVAIQKTEKELLENYPKEVGDLVLNKLHNIITGLNYNTHKKSIAIYVSPVFEKVLYLDIPVEEKIIVDESFEIRDLVYCKKQLHNYLVLVLSSKESKMFLGNSETFVRISSTTPDSVYAYVNDAPERVANFSDVNERKAIITEKFLLHVDKGLDIILNAYQLPLFVLGVEKIIGHFKKLTKHGAAVIDYVHGNYEEATGEELKRVLHTYVADWKQVKQKDLLNLLNDAADKKKLAVGIKNVWAEAMNQKGRLLVVEKNYMYPAQHGGNADEIYPAGTVFNKFSHIKDAVDDVIEKVLENGGDVEFTDPPLLGKYEHIALIEYY